MVSLHAAHSFRPSSSTVAMLPWPFLSQTITFSHHHHSSLFTLNKIPSNCKTGIRNFKTYPCACLENSRLLHILCQSKVSDLCRVTSVLLVAFLDQHVPRCNISVYNLQQFDKSKDLTETISCPKTPSKCQKIANLWVFCKKTSPFRVKQQNNFLVGLNLRLSNLFLNGLFSFVCTAYWHTCTHLPMTYS